MTGIERIEDGRFLHQFFETPRCGIGFLPPDQQINSPDFGQLHERIGQPHFADEAGDANEHDVFPSQRPADRKRTRVPDAIEINDRPIQDWKLPGSRNHGGLQRFDAGQTQIAHRSLHGTPAIRPGAVDAGEKSPRPHHRLQKSAGSNSVAKFEAVGDQPLHSQMLRQRTHHMLQALAHQHDFVAGFDAGLK